MPLVFRDPGPRRRFWVATGLILLVGWAALSLVTHLRRRPQPSMRTEPDAPTFDRIYLRDVVQSSYEGGEKSWSVSAEEIIHRKTRTERQTEGSSTSRTDTRPRQGGGSQSPDYRWLSWPGCGCFRGRTRVSQVPGPSSFVRAVVRDPAGCDPSSPVLRGVATVAFRQFNTLGTAE
jgi:hypothetical protein